MQDKIYACSYAFQGSRHAFQIYAADDAEAEAKLAALKSWAKIDGELIFMVPIPTGTPPGLVRVFGDVALRVVRWWRGE